MKSKLAIILLVSFAVGIGFSSCKSKNQCKQYHKKQKKRRRMSETIHVKDVLYTDYIKTQTV